MNVTGRGSITVLLVEDSSDTREVLAEFLELNGLRVLAARSAAEAEAAGVAARRIDLLLVDLHLPDGDGGQVACTLQRRHPEMRSLFLSGDWPPPLGAGQAFLRKPVRLATLLGEIQSLLHQSA